MNSIPCHTCGNRTPVCHAECEQYRAAMEDRLRISQWLRDQNRRSSDAERITHKVAAKRRIFR